ncbi:MAG: malto-oligosyltrehalose synthase [Acidobacteria bacterium]|nr:malto-oligosyltrehalose synthase [Acidobacteriota bacterium]
MARVPGSTYRIQLHKHFTFDDAADIAEYLKTLGLTHIYSSPYLQAAPDSMHGYDVVDHRKVNEELGGAAAHERFCKTLGDAGLGQILDIVPNHMSLGSQNKYWWDVLENGTNSRYASFFDIDWNSSEERLRDKVLVPILADQYGRVLSDGGVKLSRQGAMFTVEAAGQTFPVSPSSLCVILGKAAEYAKSDTLNFLSSSFARLPSPDFWDRRTILARHRDKNVLHGLLERLCSEENNVCSSIDRVVREVNSNVDALDEFLSQQYYRLSYWKTADQQLGYRRFFDVNTLIGLRVEREFVFDETHALIVRWLKQGVLDGVRVDHPDGLRDPKQYLDRLRERAPNAWIVGEKILEPGEWLRDDWPIEGTTGYDFLNVAMGVLVDRDGLKRLGEHYIAFTGDNAAFSSVAHDKKIAVTQEALGSDVNRLTSLFVDICENNRDQRDFTRAEIRRAIRELAACFSIYRTYVIPEQNAINDEDRSRITSAIECAKSSRTDIDGGLFDFIRDVLTLKCTGTNETEFVNRFQQFTGPVMAKGVEDTAFYCWNRLIAMNEVGADPECGGFTLEYFHNYQSHVQKTFPLTMTSLGTHDTKRSDDVRARMIVLSEIPDDFAEAAGRWSALNATYESADLIDPGTKWFLYQTLVGAWPITTDRLKLYMQKAMREAKVRTSWVSNNEDYENALNDYIDGMLSDATFVADIEAFIAGISLAGRVNSLSQTLLKYTSPGVPDLYQGGELWDLSLVDPDNRRPVDYRLRKKLLHELETMDLIQIMARSDDGLPKLWLIHRAMQLRNEHPSWFGKEASYIAVKAQGQQSERVLAYLRGEDVLTVVPRYSQRASAWEDTAIEIPNGRWRDQLSGLEFDGGQLRLETLLELFPVALLFRRTNEVEETPNA